MKRPVLMNVTSVSHRSAVFVIVSLLAFSCNFFKENPPPPVDKPANPDVRLFVELDKQPHPTIKSRLSDEVASWKKWLIGPIGIQPPSYCFYHFDDSFDPQRSIDIREISQAELPVAWSDSILSLGVTLNGQHYDFANYLKAIKSLITQDVFPNFHILVAPHFTDPFWLRFPRSQNDPVWYFGAVYPGDRCVYDASQPTGAIFYAAIENYAVQARQYSADSLNCTLSEMTISGLLTRSVHHELYHQLGIPDIHPSRVDASGFHDSPVRKCVMNRTVYSRIMDRNISCAERNSRVRNETMSTCIGAPHAFEGCSYDTLRTF